MTIHPKNLCPARLTSRNSLISLSIPIWLKTVFMEVVYRHTDIMDNGFFRFLSFGPSHTHTHTISHKHKLIVTGDSDSLQCSYETIHHTYIIFYLKLKGT